MKKLKRIDVVFLLNGLLWLVICEIFSTRSLDIIYHDTYFVIVPGHIGFIFLMVYVAYAVAYFTIRKHQKQFLGFLHWILITPFLAGQVVSTIYAVDGKLPSYANSAIFAIMFLFGNLIFLVNIGYSIAGTIKQRTRK